MKTNCIGSRFVRKWVILKVIRMIFGNVLFTPGNLTILGKFCGDYMSNC